MAEEKYGTKAIIALLADVKNKISDIAENAVNKEDFKELTDKVTALEEQLDTKEDVFSPGEGLEMTEDRILNITLDTEIFWVNATLPDTPPVGKSNKILLVPNASSEDEGNYYTEYIWVVDTEHPDGHYEELGTYKSDIDLSAYQSKQDNNLQTTDKTVVGAINEINEVPIKKGTGNNSLKGNNISENVASGENSTALGDGTEASGHCSMANGCNYTESITTKATDEGAHAFGIGVQAISRGSFAEGVRTIAGDIYGESEQESSHAEGYRTRAFGGSSHAEGGKLANCPENRAYAYGSHVEGASNTAFSGESHAEGLLNLAYGICSHIEGVGLGYHTETIPTITFNSENKQIIIADDYTAEDVTNSIRGSIKVIIEGAIIIINNKFFNVTKVELIDNNTVVTVQEKVQTIENIDYFAIYNKGLAIGASSHVEGGGGKAIGNYSHVEGAICIASGEYSHAEGGKTIASGDSAHSEGNNCVASGITSHAEGNKTTASGNGSHSEGQYSIASGKMSHAEGDYTIATNRAEHAQGTYNKSNTGETSDLQTIHSIGIGSSEDDRKNAVEVMVNGDAYLYGVGNYNGTNPTTAKRLQDILNNVSEYIIVPTLTSDYTIPANATTREYIYEISIGATTYNVTAAEGIKWIDNNLPLVEANSKLIVSVVNNIAVWGTVYE